MKSKNKSAKRKILITGGAGYVGSVLTEKLIKEGFNVKVFDRLYFTDIGLKHLSDQVEIVQGDIRNIPEDLFDLVDSVVHLAGFSNDPTAEFNPEVNLEVNTLATIKLAQLAKKNKVKRFIFASSCSIYDLGIESENGLKDELSTVNPKAPYSVSKYTAETGLLNLADKNFCVTNLRKGTVCGFSPRLRYDLVLNTMVKNAMNSKTIKVFCKGIQWRPILTIEDAVNAYLKVLTIDPKLINKQIFNVSTGNFLIKDLAIYVQSILKEHFDIHTEVIYEQPNRKDRSYRVSTFKAEEILGLTSNTSIVSSTVNLINNIQSRNLTDFANPIYYNIDWMNPIFEQELNSK